MGRYYPPRRPPRSTYGNYPKPWQMQPAAQPAAPKSSNKIVIVLILIALIAIVVVLFIMLKGSPEPQAPERLMDLRIKNMDAQVKQGEELNYEVEAMNLGTAQLYDIILRHDIYTANGDWLSKLRVEETVALKDKSTFPRSVKLNVTPGEYKLRIAVNYGGETGIASQNFEVISVDEEVTEPTITEDPFDEPEPTVEDDPEPQDDPTENIEKLSGKTDAEFEAEALADSSNPTKAIQLCISISSEYNADFCLNELAEKSENVKYCEPIKDESKMNNCYMTLALEGQSELCDKITDGYKKNTCLALV